jgi:hypothetical protein
MPSSEHDSASELFVLDPHLAGRLLSLAGVSLPPGSQLVPGPASETGRMLSKDLIPDRVLAGNSAEKPACIVIVEIQLEKKPEKFR